MNEAAIVKSNMSFSHMLSTVLYSFIVTTCGCVVEPVTFAHPLILLSEGTVLPTFLIDRLSHSNYL